MEKGPELLMADTPEIAEKAIQNIEDHFSVLGFRIDSTTHSNCCNTLLTGQTFHMKVRTLQKTDLIHRSCNLSLYFLKLDRYLL